MPKQKHYSGPEAVELVRAIGAKHDAGCLKCRTVVHTAMYKAMTQQEWEEYLTMMQQEWEEYLKKLDK